MKQAFAIIELHAAAPAKPDLGEPCNGCGVCCATVPCPVGMFVLLQLRGRCRALTWQAESSRYVCVMAIRPSAVLPCLPAALDPWAGRWFARRIAAGQGCDADLDTVDTPD